MSEALFLVNPAKKRRKKKHHRKGRMPAGLRRYWASRRRMRRGKRKAVGGDFGINPRRRKYRHRRRASNPKRRSRRGKAVYVRTKRGRMRKINPHRRRHRRHHNPFGVRGITRTIMPAVIGATGAVALDVAYGYGAKYLPAQLQTGFLPVLVKAAGAIGLGMLARKVVSREKANIATLGALTVVAYGAIKPLIAQFAPTVPGLSGYADYIDYGTSMGAYLPQRQMGFYSPAPTVGTVPGTQGTIPSQFGAYLPPQMHGLDMPQVPSWQADGM